MAAPLKTIEGSADIAATMREIGLRAKAAARVLAIASTEQKNRALAGDGRGDPRQQIRNSRRQRRGSG